MLRSQQQVLLTPTDKAEIIYEGELGNFVRVINGFLVTEKLGAGNELGKYQVLIPKA